MVPTLSSMACQSARRSLLGCKAFAKFALLIRERVGDGFNLFGVKVLRGELDLV
jgi:hypothetical protein